MKSKNYRKMNLLTAFASLRQYDESLKLINSTLGHFNEFIKKHEDRPEKVREKETNEH